VKRNYAAGVRIIGFDVLTAVFMKTSIIWDITPCSLAVSQKIKPFQSESYLEFRFGFLEKGIEGMGCDL
jgi:hypothetical protein